ncbi:putative oxidoreductase [Helianthus annuus]|uniref:Carotenoid cleavage dioxygenase 4-like protein n=1 Tax=Helianthus annuus TaxID=4232 RepID=A0A0K3A5X2_HELAN|nr:probable carotenoid cleavage dioxygenase 4, chloroplastic [Helianthus annuus]KAF5795720.1 putative oxidoreductase [Helianthus annuus]KAJ0539184.1 putative oxidoreductase [Helianthus annuus]KAJ0547272.1 putative oxidoreductase [Helianthus annuus]KAJ0553834.1 putative oxidoreductase [Helianthus annuus]KAJ0722719.1 putative oxidoreductase [Helianthus annuus]
MDSLSSSFISIFSQSNSTVSHPPPSSSSPPSALRVFSVRTEEKPETVTSTATTKRPSGPKKQPTLNIRKRESSVVVDQSLPATIFNAFDSIINNFIDPPARVSVDPKHVLSDNFSPVDELPPTDCEVIEGTLPSCLDGAYFRNGPNPQFLPRGPYHLFDGDGMLHAIRISNGKASLCSRYIKTYKYSIEKEAGFPIIPNVFSGFNGVTASAARMAVTAGRFLAGQFDPTKGIGLANTSLAFFGNRLFALGESDLPYAVKLAPDGDIVTVGREDFDGKLFMSMTAHPKIDPVTKEAFAFRYGPVPPFLTFFRFNENGEKQADVPIFSMTSPSFLHDFAITKNYAIFPEIQIGMSPMEMLGGGSPVSADAGKVPRLGLIPRYAKDESEMKWFEVPGFNVIHCINAWEEDGGDTVVMVAPNILSVEHTLERMDLIHASVEKVKINLKTGMVSRHPLSTRNLDFAVLNPAFVAVKNRYMYCGVGDPMPKISGVVKLDVSLSEADRRECIVASRMFGPGCYGGEPFFVAREPDNPDADEDDGYVVSYVHNENTGESRFVVMDAKSPTLEIVAAVKLPHRVPYGFHGLFVRESDINKL